EALRLLLRRGQRPGIVADDVVVYVGRQFLECFGQLPRSPAAQMVEDRRRRALDQAVALEDGQGVGKGGRVGGRRAGGNDVKWVADDVGDNEAKQGAAGERLGESAALDVGQVFAHCVHLVDGGAASVQETCDLLLVGQRHAGDWGRQERGAAAREQA